MAKRKRKPTPEYLTIPGVAEIFRVSPPTMRRIIARMTDFPSPVGWLSIRKWRTEDVMEYAKKNRVIRQEKK